MKAKTITLQKLKQGNKRLCLSAKRVLGQCFKCLSYGGKYKRIGEVKKIYIKPCESRIINLQYNKLQIEKEKLYKDIENINKKIKEV